MKCASIPHPISMKKYRISPLTLMLMAAFIVIDGTWFALYAVLCALWHEIWHIIVLRYFGGNTCGLTVKQYGVSLKTTQISYKQEAIVALAGPAASLFAFLLFGVMSYRLAFTETTVFLTFSNLAVFTVNILPIYPLDGGRALYCLLCMKLDMEKTVKIVKIISFIFLLPLTFFSVIILIRTGYNLSLMLICIYLAVLMIGVKDI